MIKRIVLAAALAVAATTCAYSQAGQFPAGYVQGNAGASAGQGSPSSVTAILDRALSSTRGSIIERGASGWAAVGPSATAGLPWVSGGTGADPLYQVLGIVGGGTNCGVASGTCLDNITGFASNGYLKRTGAGAYSLIATVPVGDGGTNCSSASGTCLDNITGFATTGYIKRTGAGSYVIGTVASADLNITTTACSAGQSVNSISSGGVGTCASPMPIVTTKTTGSTLSNSDCNTIIPLGGASFYDMTLTAASNYTTVPCIIEFQNNDTRGKRVVASGVMTTRLMPGQSIRYEVISSAWYVPDLQRVQRWAATSYTIYVGATSPSDTVSDGLGGCAGSGNFATPAAAIQFAKFNMDTQGNSALVQLCNGTYTTTSTINFFGSPVGYHLVTVQGDCSSLPGTEINVVVRYTGTAGGTLFQSRDLGIGIVQCLTADTSNTQTDVAFFAAQGSTLDVNSVRTGNFLSLFDVDNLGSTNLSQVGAAGSGNPGISTGANFGNFSRMFGATKLVAGTWIDVTGRTIGQKFIDIKGAGANANFSGGFIGTATGTQGSCIDYGVLTMNGLTIPGTAASYTATNCQTH